MSNENTNKEKETTQDGSAQKSLEEKVESLSAAVFKMSVLHGNALDMMYIQLIAIIEILSDEKLITPEKWEQKLEAVSKSMEERIKEKMNDQQGDSGQVDDQDPNGTNEGTGSGKIIVPDRRIIVP